MADDFKEIIKEELVEQELNRLITVSEAAELLGVSKTTIRRMSNANLIPTYRIGTGRHRRFRKRDILRLLESK